MIIDVHVHLLGMQEANGCYASPRLSTGIYYTLLKYLFDLRKIDRGAFDDAYRTRLVRWAEESDLDGVGLLALDGIYDRNGELDLARTPLVVSNDYCLKVCRDSPKLLPICSVNPQRKDALEELERVSEAGAVALKALPNTQAFDPGDDAYRPFWRRMAELRLPLLTHTSFEHTLPVVKQRHGEPERLRPALEEGVTVIAAHCATAGINHVKEHMHTWIRMLEEFPKLYGDISSFAYLSRFPYVRKILNHPLARERVMLGSDHPVPVAPMVLAHQIGWRKAWQLRKIQNPLQRNLEIFQAVGVGDAILTRAAKVLRLKKEHVEITPNNEINGSTMGGVGRGALEASRYDFRFSGLGYKPLLP